MTDTTFSTTNDHFAPGEQVQVISFLVTDDELLLLLQDAPGALMKLYPEGEEELSRGVANAVKRSLIARRAAILGDETGGRLELLQPWAGLVEHLSGGGRFCRITTDGDDRTARLILVGDDALFTVDRDPSGIHTVTISIPEFAAQLATDPFARDDDAPEVDVASGDRAPVRLRSDALVEGRRLLEQGADDEAERLLGDTTDLFRQATTTFRVETMQLTGGVVRGSEFDVLDAGAFGWVRVAGADDDPAEVVVTTLSGEALADAMAEALTSS